MASAFTEAVVSLLSSVPAGRVVTYGGLARAAGSPRAARQVVRILHSQSSSRGLPWHRVLNSAGRVALTDPEGAELQRALLASEGVVFEATGAVDLERFEWRFPPP